MTRQRPPRRAALFPIEPLQRYRDLASQRWPVRPEPLFGELLSIWLTRLALANGLPPADLGELLGFGGALWAARLDLAPPAIMVAYLAEMADVATESIDAASLTAELGPYERLLLPLHLAPSARQPAWLQFCPHCLRNDEFPYFRKAWRFASLAVCPFHRRCLVDRCTVCQAPIGAYRHRALQPLYSCVACGQDLRALKTEPCRPREAREAHRLHDRLRYELLAGLPQAGELALLLDGLPGYVGRRFSRKISAAPLAKQGLSDRRFLLQAFLSPTKDQRRVLTEERGIGIWRRRILDGHSVVETAARLFAALQRRAARRARGRPMLDLSEADLDNTFARGSFQPRVVRRPGGASLATLLSAYTGSPVAFVRST